MIKPEILHHRARSLRKNTTHAELLMWRRLRARRFEKYKFRRQRPIGHYIVDFVCLWKKLIIEIDGGQHDERKEYDDRRTAFLRKEGFTVMRFWNGEVYKEIDRVMENIWDALMG